MKFVGLTSGGKDSYYAIMECLRNGHTLVACAHLAPHPNSPSGEESYMYQTAASEAVQIQVEECLEVPLLVRACRGKSRRTTLVYELECQDDNKNEQEDEDEEEGMDEVEDMYELLKEVQRTYPEVEAVSSGSILSTYQRVRVESVCQRLGWTSLGYLWRAGTQRELLDTMLADEMEAVLVRVACPPLLLPRRHLNKTLRHLQDCGLFPRLEARLDFAVCGEGGEYETLVLDCPIFLKRLVLDSVSIQVDDDSDDGIGVLKIHSCHAEPKSSTSLWNLNGPVLCDRIQRPHCPPISSSLLSFPTNSIEPKDTAASLSSSSYPAMTSKKKHYLAQYKILSCGLVHMSEIMSSKCYPQRKGVPHETEKLTTSSDNEDEEEAESWLAVEEGFSIF
jgi:diphthine-ammonia ligase